MSFQNYIDNMMQNQELNSESANDTYNQKNMTGGNNLQNTHATGGFPPIFLCSDSQTNYDYEDDDSEKKKRQYTTHKNSVSIKQIIDKRKEITPFIPFNGISKTTKKK